MHCEICGRKTKDNFGDSNFFICKKCYEIEDEDFINDLKERKLQGKRKTESQPIKSSDNDYTDLRKSSFNRSFILLFLVFAIPISIFMISKMKKAADKGMEKAADKLMEAVGDIGSSQTLRKTARNVDGGVQALDELENASKRYQYSKKIEKSWNAIKKSHFFWWCNQQGYITRIEYNDYKFNLTQLNYYKDHPPKKLEKYLDVYVNRN